MLEYEGFLKKYGPSRLHIHMNYLLGLMSLEDAVDFEEHNLQHVYIHAAIFVVQHSEAKQRWHKAMLEE